METINNLGDFLSDKRKKNNLSQEEVSSRVDLSRVAYSQIEKNNRSVKVTELVKLSEVLNFSISDALFRGFNFPNERAKPIFNYEKFKATLLYILKRCENKANVGKIVLYKLLYFTDFNYFEKYKTFLTGVRYSKLPMGPVPNVTDILEQLQENGDIELVNTMYFNFPQMRYEARVNPDLSVLSEKEIKVIDDVLIEHSNKTGSEISEYSHGDAPWLETRDFGEIDYNLVFNRNEKYKYNKN